jgi:hypothetical protein
MKVRDGGVLAGGVEAWSAAWVGKVGTLSLCTCGARGFRDGSFMFFSADYGAFSCGSAISACQRDYLVMVTVTSS